VATHPLFGCCASHTRCVLGRSRRHPVAGRPKVREAPHHRQVVTHPKWRTGLRQLCAAPVHPRSLASAKERPSRRVPRPTWHVGSEVALRRSRSPNALYCTTRVTWPHTPPACGVSARRSEQQTRQRQRHRSRPSARSRTAKTQPRPRPCSCSSRCTVRRPVCGACSLCVRWSARSRKTVHAASRSPRLPIRKLPH
jgi:hypothetical protein